MDQLVRVVGDLITYDSVASSPSIRPKSDQFPASRQDTTQAMPATSVTCAYCRRRGHGIEDCRTRTRAHPSAPPTSKFDNVCFNCNQEGHYSRQCPFPRKGGSRPSSSEAQNNTNKPPQHPKVSQVGDNDVTTHAVYLPATLGKIKLNCLLDSGCDVTSMPAKLVGHCKLRSVDKILYAANGTQIKVEGELDETLRISGVAFQYVPWVTVPDWVNKLVSEISPETWYSRQSTSPGFDA